MDFPEAGCREVVGFALLPRNDQRYNNADPQRRSLGMASTTETITYPSGNI